MDPIIAGIIAGILALATLALVGVYIAAATRYRAIQAALRNEHDKES